MKPPVSYSPMLDFHPFVKTWSRSPQTLSIPCTAKSLFFSGNFLRSITVPAHVPDIIDTSFRKEEVSLSIVRPSMRLTTFSCCFVPVVGILVMLFDFFVREYCYCCVCLYANSAQVVYLTIRLIQRIYWWLYSYEVLKK